MGGSKYPEKTRPEQRTFGKIEAHLTEKLQQVKWAEFELQELFEKIKVKKLNYKTNDLPNKPEGDFNLPALTAGIQNQGLNNYVPRNNATVLKNVISISANGANTGATFYQNKEFTVLQDAYAIKWIYTDDILTDNQHIFLTASISKAIYGNYEWTNKAGWERIKGNKIPLPIKTNANLVKLAQIDFDFMENFIAQLEAFRLSQLEAYLLVTGLKDYTLTAAEQQALADFENGNVVWGEYNLEKLFGKSTRGKRLKSADRIAGDLPFVTAGEAETGVSAFIGNKVEIFKANTTTIDMFGSAKYRNYDYGGDDHIAVVHTENLNKYAAIFMTSAIHKSSYTGKFSYARNFYAKDADELNIQLPTSNQQPDYGFMETLISAVQKLVIKEVVLYADRKIAATRQVIEGD